VFSEDNEKKHPKYAKLYVCRTILQSWQYTFKTLCDVIDRILIPKSEQLPNGFQRFTKDSRTWPSRIMVMMSVHECKRMVRHSDIHRSSTKVSILWNMASKLKLLFLQNCMQVSRHFHFKASNKEPDDQMDMFLYPPDEETTLRKSVKTLIHILYVQKYKHPQSSVTEFISQKVYKALPLNFYNKTPIFFCHSGKLIFRCRR
jgi:hypothetical protein